MFTLQAAAAADSVGQATNNQDLAQALLKLTGSCNAPLSHRGSVSVTSSSPNAPAVSLSDLVNRGTPLPSTFLTNATAVPYTQPNYFVQFMTPSQYNASQATNGNTLTVGNGSSGVNGNGTNAPTGNTASGGVGIYSPGNNVMGPTIFMTGPTIILPDGTPGKIKPVRTPINFTFNFNPKTCTGKLTPNDYQDFYAYGPGEGTNAPDPAYDSGSDGYLPVADPGHGYNGDTSSGGSESTTGVTGGGYTSSSGSSLDESFASSYGY
jgi:hypothetical protein